MAQTLECQLPVKDLAARLSFLLFLVKIKAISSERYAEQAKILLYVNIGSMAYVNSFFSDVYSDFDD